ncbi:MAG TPA: DUF882 domain-containing protein [Burkholderiaceae bacterium]
MLSSPESYPLFRRRLLQLGSASLLAACGIHPVAARAREGLADADLWSRPRELWITRPQAQETVRAVYWANARIQPDGYRAINRIYRDLIAGSERSIAIGLLNLNYAMQAAVARFWSPQPLVLLSGFRTARTNALVGGTEPNIHFSGLADDFIYAGLSLQDNYRLARYFQVGGLGFYPDRGSLHKDIGRLRSWIEYGPGRRA